MSTFYTLDISIQMPKHKNRLLPGGRSHDVVAVGALKVLFTDIVRGQYRGPLPAHPVQPAVLIESRLSFSTPVRSSGETGLIPTTSPL